MSTITGYGYNKSAQKVLAHAVENRRGYLKDLNKYGTNATESLRSVGMINTGATLKESTYSVTKLGNRYYKDVHGTFNYLALRAKGFIKKLLNK